MLAVVVKLAWNLEVPIPGDALLETIGRRTGQPQRTPICDGLDGRTFWVVAQRGRRADWVRNIDASPRVRVKVSGLCTRWRTGTAQIVDDDPRERLRILGRGDLARRFCVCTSAAVSTSPLPIRIDLDTPDPAGQAFTGVLAGGLGICVGLLAGVAGCRLAWWGLTRGDR
jgi:deazaflavin-dependent oxidoreductase (nitroreductase family)